MSLQLRSIREQDHDDVLALALRAWPPVHASMATVLGERLNARIYPDWATEQEEGVRSACNDPEVHVTVAADGHTILGFVAVLIDEARATGEIDMIAVDPRAQRRGAARALTEHALAQTRIHE